MTNKANHQANIVTVRELLPHNNADTLEIIPVGEYQVVTRIGQFKVGDLGVYIQPDSVIPQTAPFSFIWQPYLDDLLNNPLVCKHENSVLCHEDSSVCVKCLLTDPFHPRVPEKKRRITVRKFRGEWSEGLLLPITDFPGLEVFLGIHIDTWEGFDVSGALGITHYDPDEEGTKGENSNAPKLKRKYPHSFRGWFNFLRRRVRNFFRIGPNTDGSTDNISLNIPVYDVNALKNYPNTFQEGEPVIVTEKIHGSNARYIFMDGIMYAGSRKLWKSASSGCIFRKALKELPWIESWCRAHEGYVLWGEVGPSQKGFEYGTKKGDIFFFVFDIRTPLGEWLDREHDEAGLLAQLMEHSVPILYQGPWELEKIKSLVEGQSLVSRANHIREGIVVKSASERIVRGLGRAQLKLVSNAFLEKDSK
jgi:hypothetical protein